MRNFKMVAALLTGAVFPVAYDNAGKWKMDGDKLAVDGDGNPIFIKPDNTEQSVKGDTITNLNGVARDLRVAKEAAEAQLVKFKGLDGKPLDPEIAAKAVDTVSKIDAKKLIDAGEVDKVKDQIRSEFTTLLAEKDTALNSAGQTIANLNIDKVFDGSDFVREGIAVPRDMFQSTFKQNLKFEDGKVTAYDRNGNRLMSKKVHGEYADPNEALELLVDMHPQKDAIRKAATAGGSGNGGGGGARGSGRVIRRAEFDGLTPVQQAEVAASVGKGEATISD